MKQAVVLKYDEKKDFAPKITASGKGIIAEKIIEKAKESSVPLHEDESLTKSLIDLDLGSEIPRELFEIVAKVLVFVENIDERKVKKG